MPYNIQLPNGVMVQVDDEVTPEQARMHIVRKFPDLFKRPQGFGPAMSAGWDRAVGASEGFGADLAKKFNLPSVEGFLRKQSDKNMQEAQTGYDPTTQEDVSAGFDRGITSGIGALSRKYLTEPVGGMVGSLGPAAIGAAAGAMSPIPGGATLGFAAPYFAQSAGENQARQREAKPGTEPDIMKSTVTALAQTALGTFGFGKMVHGALGSQLAMREAANLAPKVLSGEITKEAAVHSIGSTLRNVLAETTASAGINIGTGVADEALRRVQAGQPLGDADALNQYKDIAATGAVLAPIFGAFHGTGARGSALRHVEDAARARTEKLTQEARQQAADQTAAAQAQALNEAPEPVAKDPQQAAALLKQQIDDGARRAVEQRDQPGVLNPERPLETIDTNGQQRRADAEAAFKDAVVEPDLLAGEMAKPAVPEAVRTERTRAEDMPVPAGQAELPLDALTSRGQFKNMVYETSPTYKSGALDGHDLSTVKGVQDLTKVLKGYLRNVEDNEKNAPRIAALNAKLEELAALKDQLKGKSDAPVIPPDAAATRTKPADAVVAAKPEPVPATEVANVEQVQGADARAAVSDMGQRGEPQAVPGELPPAVGRGDGGGDAPVTETVRRESAVDPALAALQERAKFGRDIGAVVDAGGNVLKGRQQTALGRAVNEGDFEGVVSALASSKNEMIKHVGEQVAKLEGIKPKALPDEAMADIVPNHESITAKASLDMLDGLRQLKKAVEEGNDFQEAAQKINMARLSEVEGVPVNLAERLGTVDRNQYLDTLNTLENEFGSKRAYDALSKKAETPITMKSPVYGEYLPDKKEAHIAQSRAKHEHVVAHELVHAMTHMAIDSPTKEQRPFVQKLDMLYQHVRRTLDAEAARKGKRDNSYGLSNLHEFVAEAYTNPDFQQKLSKIKYRNTTAWGAFTDYIAKLLGLKNDNAFTEFLANAEGLEKVGNMVELKPEGKSFKLGEYRESATPQLPEHRLGAHINEALDIVRSQSPKEAVAHLTDKLINAVFDDKHGITRHLERAWTRATGTGREATANALLQASTYGAQLGRESLSFGFVKKNAEGFWKMVRDKDNLRSFLDAIDKLPTDQDKMRVANGIITNLAYDEREQMLGHAKQNAQKLLAQALQDRKDAAKLKGRAAAVAYRRANAKKAMAEDLLDKEFKRPASVTDETIAQAREDAKTPEVKAMLDIVRGINHQNIDMLLEGGIIDTETAELWKEKKHYVPLQRIMDQDERDPAMPLAQGGARTRDIKKFMGSEREVQDITENLIKQRLYVVDAAMRNNAYRKAIEELMAEPGNPAGVRALGDKPVDVRGRIPAIKIDGEKQYFSVEDPLAFKSFQGIVQDAPGFVNALEHVTKFFREAVMLSPDAIWRNLVRDTTEVWSYGASDKNAAGVFGSIFSQFAKSMPGVAKEGFSTRIHQPHYEVADFGIVGAKEFTSLGAEREAIVREQLKRTGTRNWGATADGIIDGMQRMFKPLQNMAAEGELAPRNHVFKQVLARTGSETEAAMAAINTLDFRRRGSSQLITVAKKLIPFFNSQLQGWYKLATALRGNNLSSGFTDRKAAMRVLYTKAAKMAAAAWLYQTYMQQDPDYMEVPKDTRDTNILIHVGYYDDAGKKIFMRMPLPFEFGSMFWTMPANLNATLTGAQDKEEFAKASRAALLRAMPSVLPQVAKPMLENWVNYSFFGDRTLENSSVSKLEPGQRYYSTTSEFAKHLGEQAGLSPIKIDNFLKGYFGSLGAFGVQIVDAFLSDDTGPATATNKLPGLRSVLTDPLSSASRNRFYDIKERVDQVRNTAMELAKKDPEAARAYLAKETAGVPNKTLFDMYRGVQALDRKLQTAGQAEKAIRNSKDTPEMKRARLDQIRRMTNAYIAKSLPGLQGVMEEGDNEEE